MFDDPFHCESSPIPQSSKVEKERRVRMAMLAWLNMNVYWLEMANFKI